MLPPEIVALGAVTGLTYGLLAVGLVLVYRSSRFINFAHGEIGVFAAALLALVVTRAGVPYWLAFPLALVVGAGVGATTEVVVVRRLAKAPKLLSMIATLVLAQFLLVFALVVNSTGLSGAVYPKPAGFPGEFVWGAVFVTKSHIAMAVLTPIVVAALLVFFRRSRFGMAIRAAAANPDAAALAGHVARDDGDGDLGAGRCALGLHRGARHPDAWPLARLRPRPEPAVAGPRRGRDRTDARPRQGVRGRGGDRGHRAGGLLQHRLGRARVDGAVRADPRRAAAAGHRGRP
jgi:ABC-type xylose transport system permease subunit